MSKACRRKDVRLSWWGDRGKHFLSKKRYFARNWVSFMLFKVGCASVMLKDIVSHCLRFIHEDYCGELH